MKESKGSICKLIISKMVVKEKINWPREMKIAKKLLELYPDSSFWKKINSQQYFSLSYFLTPEGLDFLKTQEKLAALNIEATEQTKELGEKIGEDFKFTPSTKTLIQFLRKK